MRWKKWTWILLLLAVAAVLITRGLQPRPVLVEAGAVRKDRLEITIEEEGRTRVTDRFIISAPIAGLARRIDLEVGDPVAEGGIITTIEPASPVFLDDRTRAETEAQISAANAAVRNAEDRARAVAADAAYAASQSERTRKLFESGDVSRDAYDRALSQARQTEAVRSAAQHAVEQARNAVEALHASLRVSASSQRTGKPESVVVRAPAGGRVLKLLHESAGIVNPGEPLIEIANPRALEVEVELLSPDAVRVGPGTRVRFERWGGDAPIEGRVRKVEPTAFTKISALGVEEQRVRVIADLTSPRQQWDRLGDGYRVEARFLVWEGDGILTVPATALFPQGDGWAVFVIEGGVARSRSVGIGRRNGLSAQVLGGLKEGDRVVLHPATTISDGTQVTEQRTENPG
ncbi:MAG: HlyD family efflux transporter periplasmic adaptor subunit [Bryobacteraceae bacterium]|nr:HlyD family efflux transporter periplasmic adaptor subunit [Bryobacteraceae bacterium]